MNQLDGMKRWKCPNGHVLGVTQEKLVEQNGRKFFVDRMILFRQALDPQAEIPEDVDVIAALEGTTLDVRCSVPGCGGVRTWYMGEAALERLIEKIRVGQT